MTTPTLHAPGRPAPPTPRLSLLGGLAAGAVAMLVAASAFPLLDAMAPSLPLALVGGMALLLLVALAVARYDAAVFLGFLLSGVVKFEPAPPDGVFAIILAVSIVTGRLRAGRVPAPLLGALAALLALNVTSFMDAVSLGYGALFSAITLYVIVLGVWLAGYADRPSRGRRVVVAWLAIALFSAVLGTLALQFPGFPLRETFIGDGSSRASALFKDPNVYGPFLVPIAVIVLEELINPQVLRLRTISGLACVAVLVIGVIFSFSRASWANMLLSTAIMLLVLLLRRRDMRRVLGVVGGLAIVAMIVMAVIVASGNADFIGQRAQLQGYDSERFGAQRAGIALAESHLLGVGPGQFQFHHPIETHSTYVRVLAEQGPLGLVSWLVVCLATLFYAISNALAGRRSGGIGSAALLGSWCGLLFNSAVVDTLHWRHLWVVAGLIWAGTLTGRRHPADGS